MGRSIGRQFVNLGRGTGRNTVVAVVFQVKGMNVAKSDGLFEFEPCKGVGARDEFVHGVAIGVGARARDEAAVVLM